MTQPPFPPGPPPGGARAHRTVHAYHQQTSGSQSDVAAGKTVILKVNGRFGPDEQQGGGTLGTAADVTVLP